MAWLFRTLLTKSSKEILDNTMMWGIYLVSQPLWEPYCMSFHHHLMFLRLIQASPCTRRRWWRRPSGLKSSNNCGFHSRTNCRTVDSKSTSIVAPSILGFATSLILAKSLKSAVDRQPKHNLQLGRVRQLLWHLPLQRVKGINLNLSRRSLCQLPDRRLLLHHVDERSNLEWPFVLAI